MSGTFSRRLSCVSTISATRAGRTCGSTTSSRSARAASTSSTDASKWATSSARSSSRCLTSRSPWSASALDDVDGEPAARSLLVLHLHVATGLAHRLDDLVEADDVRAVAAQCGAGGGDGLDRRDGVALDAGNLHEPTDRVAGEAEIVLHADLGGVLDLLGRATHDGRHGAGGHRAGRADLALAADLGAGDRGGLLVDHADRTRSQ